MTPGRTPSLGVVIPALDEAPRLPGLLADLRAFPLVHEVVVVDGGSADDTLHVAGAAGATVIRAPRGRASQMNAGATSLSTDWLLFLHGDCRVPPATLAALGTWLARAGPDRAAFFRFRLEGDHWFWRFIERGQGLRERLSGLAYGDQGLVVSKVAFQAVGGYPEVPLLEDVEMLRLLRARGAVERIEAPVLTSPRRYQTEGRWRVWLRNTAILAMHLAGASHDRLARIRGARLRRRNRILLVFAKDPEPGRVKTRLAAQVGDGEAARIYSELARTVVQAVRAGPYQVVICYDPADAADRVRSWLGEGDLEFWPQRVGDLGARLTAAFRQAFERASVVCAVGTDAPGVDRATVKEAFRVLDRSDVVFGPAADGGYYLVGSTAFRPELFQDIPWSTDRTLAVSLARAAEAGLTVARLAVLKDVDTAADLGEGTP